MLGEWAWFLVTYAPKASTLTYFGVADRGAQTALREVQMGESVGGSVRILSPATSFRKKPLGENGGGSTLTTEAGE
jgi:hypothetical protein